jgi:acetoin utilization protein AcuB
MRVRDLMTSDPSTLPSDASLGDAADLMASLRVRHLPLMDHVGGKDVVAGIVSDRDIQMALGTDARASGPMGRDPRQAGAPVDWFMTQDVVSIGPDATASALCALFVDLRVGAVPVMDGGRLVGIVSVLDVVRAAGPLLDGQG